MAEHTFLFADLVGFTALTDSEGDDRAAEVALGLYDRVRRLLPRYDAEELKTLGDGVALRCDRADHGIELAVNIVEELDSAPSFPPVRVGVHTGPAVERDGDWYGRTVNVAARLCSAAGGGEALVSEHAREAAGRLRGVEFSERRLHWLRNVTEPIPAHVASPRHQPLAGRLAPLRRALMPASRRCSAGLQPGVAGQ
ncbi:MAG TPA: adenylate/guanylate cyclase domain-containing protein [Solirubrobacterales bacterium]|nr:adenylate/guanylate cyclase domain-containing protein [Solirubrobacterales bacterium]